MYHTHVRCWDEVLSMVPFTSTTASTNPLTSATSVHSSTREKNVERFYWQEGTARLDKRLHSRSLTGEAALFRLQNSDPDDDLRYPNRHLFWSAHPSRYLPVFYFQCSQWWTGQGTGHSGCLIQMHPLMAAIVIRIRFAITSDNHHKTGPLPLVV